MFDFPTFLHNYQHQLAFFKEQIYFKKEKKILFQLFLLNLEYLPLKSLPLLSHGCMGMAEWS